MSGRRAQVVWTMALLVVGLGCGGSLFRPTSAPADGGRDAPSDGPADHPMTVGDVRSDVSDAPAPSTDGTSDPRPVDTGESGGDTGCAVDCAPFQCRQGRCLSSCAGDGDCVGSARCRSGTCRNDVSDCTSHQQCASNLCYQGVCCDRACDGTCESCALPASRGRCSPVPVDALPAQNTCGADAAADVSPDSAPDVTTDTAESDTTSD